MTGRIVFRFASSMGWRDRESRLATKVHEWSAEVGSMAWNGKSGTGGTV